MASTSVAWTPGTSGNRNKWTWSGWVKRSSLGEQAIFGCYQNGSYSTSLRFDANDKIHFEDTYNSNTNGRIITTASFRDLSAWYHIVAVFDNAAGSTAADKIKVYVNGVNQAGAYGNAPTNATTLNSSGQKIQHGQLGAGSNFDGLMSHCHFCDGYAYAASDFGSTDSSTGEWKITTTPSVSYGTNGFWIFKDGNSVTDQSSNSNNFTVEAGTFTNTEDNPSNNYCFLNPLSHGTSWSISNGNTTFNGGSITDWKYGVAGTLGAITGKYYWEVKWTSGDSYSILGVIPVKELHRCNKSDTGTDIYNYINGNQFSASSTGTIYNYGAADTTGTTRSINDIFMYAIDMDNRKMWIGENGVWDGSGNPATGANPTWDTSLFGSDWDEGFVPFTQSYQISATTEFKFNFGNGYFGTTAVSSAGTNASNNGIFEYDVPSGFTALSTKGINSF